MWIPVRFPKRKRRRNPGRRRSTPCRVDRLSALPDEILLEIIGRLDCTHQAMRTSVLSKRWRHLWTCSPTLSINWPSIIDFKNNIYMDGEDEAVIVGEDGTNKSNSGEEKRRQRINRFAEAVLNHRHGAAIRKLKFCLSPPWGLSEKHYNDAPAWLLRALQHNVEVLALEIGRNAGNVGIECAKIVSTYKSLRALSSTIIHDFRGFNELTTLELSNVTKLSYRFGEDLKNIPKLHTLSLKECTFNSILITSTSLMKLKVQSCKAIEALICAPGLSCLDIDFGYRKYKTISLRDLSSLHSVSLSIRGDYDGDFLSNIFEGLKYVCCMDLLEFDCKYLWYLHTTRNLDRYLPMFSNLVHLQLSKPQRNQYDLVWSLLRKSPKLETLMLTTEQDKVFRMSLRILYEQHGEEKEKKLVAFVGYGSSLMLFLSRGAKTSNMLEWSIY